MKGRAMAADRLTEVTHTSWFGRIGGAIKGVVVGLALFIVAFPLLFWNEGRAVKTYKTLKEGAGAVISVPADKVDASNSGMLVHITGKAATEQTLADPVFGVSANALKLRRAVEMYQWKETVESKSEKKLGGGEDTVKTYSYSKEWSDEPIASAEFKEAAGHENPAALPYESLTQTAAPITVGAFALTPSLAGRINNFAPLAVAGDAALPAALAGKGVAADGGYYLGKNPAAPEIGDVRIRFAVAPTTDVSLIAKQVESTFEPYAAKAGGNIELLETGVFSADAMFQAAQQRNQTLTWLLRAAGLFVMFLGLALVLKPLSVIADVVPVIGSIVGAGTALVALLCAAVFSLLTIALAWVFSRPVLAVTLFVMAIAIVTVIVSKLKKPRAAA